MNIEIDTKPTENLQQSSIVQQTSYWAKLKEENGLQSKAFDLKVPASELYHTPQNGNYVENDLLVFIQNTGSDSSLAYVPYGPQIEPAEDNQGAFLEELSEIIRPQLPAGCLMIRYDLLWQSPWARDDTRYQNGDWIGPPPQHNQEFRVNFNTNKWNLQKANTNILPTDTIFIDLTQSEETLLQAMKPKTRYNIRLAQRKGVQVRSAGYDEMPIWYKLYSETCQRNGIFLDNLDYFRQLLEISQKQERSKARVELLIAEVDGQPLSSMFLTLSGQRASYLYGASTNQKRNHMASYALQWAAIKRAKNLGYREYDMFGTSPNPDPSHPMYGLYRFKIGFGGQLFHRMGCWDYPLQPQKYSVYQSQEMNHQGYLL